MKTTLAWLPKKDKVTIIFLEFLWLLLCIPLSINSQATSDGSSEVSQAELEMKSYEADKTADAVVLFDKGKSYFVRVGDQFQVIFERVTRIKVLAESGVDWGEVIIPYYKHGQNEEVVSNIYARSSTYQDGQLTVSVLNKENCYDEKVNDRWMMKKFAIPNVQVGSVIEIRYAMTSSNRFVLQDWEFQRTIPTIYSEYQVSLIPFYEYNWLLQGANKFDDYTTWVDPLDERQYGAFIYNEMVHTFVMKDIPAFKDEDFITSRKDHLIKLSFQLSRINMPDGYSEDVITTWPQMIKNLMDDKDFGKYIKKSEAVAEKTLPEYIFEIDEREARIKEIVSFVKETYSWNRQNHIFVSGSVKDFMEQKTGNCAEVNLFLCGLLNGAGFEAYPVILSTRDHGKISYDYPYYDFFNYVGVIVYDDEKAILTDATDPLLNYDRIPPGCINDKGLIINKESQDWIDLMVDEPSEINTQFDIHFSGSLDTLWVEVMKTYTDYEARAPRSVIKDDTGEVSKILREKYLQAEFDDIVIENAMDPSQPYIISFDASFQPEMISDKIYISPYLDEPISQNPFIHNQRTYPVDLNYPIKKSFHSTIHIPEGYKVSYLPEDYTLNDEHFSFDYSVLIENDAKIKCTSNYCLARSVYPSSDYLRLKGLFNQIIRYLNDKIVLEKM
jgi:hypothetical protein